MDEKNVDLKLDRGLLDPLFDGYKLSLDPLATYQKELDLGPEVVNLRENQYSYQHVKGFGQHNHLYLDPWDHSSVYFINSQWKICRINVDSNSRMGSPHMVLEIPNSSYKKAVPERLNLGLQFPSPGLCVLSDGAGTLYLIDTGNREQNQLWKISHMEAVLGEDQPFVLREASICHREKETILHCLLLHIVVKDEKEASGDGRGDVPTSSQFTTVLEWITYLLEEGKSWTVSQSRRLESSCPPDYAYIEALSESLYVTTEKPLKFTYDSANPVEEEEENMEQDSNDKEPTESPPAYTWSQTDEDVSVQFTLPESIEKTDIQFALTMNTVDLGLKEGGTLLKGELNGDVDVDGSVWTLTEGNRLELHLCKQDHSFTWPLVVVGDTRGEMVMDPQQAERIHQQLAHLTSSTWNPDPEESSKPAYNAQQLEDCDAFPEESCQMCRYDGNTHSITHQVNIGSHQWLFNNCRASERPPTVCLRHDVDAIVWQPLTSDPIPQGTAPWTHIATFNAFGYVQASKQQRKYTVCAPNHSYVAICDRTRHIYIYRQPASISSPLRNRKTGRQVSAVAKQQLVALESVEDIVGCQATNEYLFVLAGKSVFVVQVNVE